jgi:phenylacetate-coenzyme A ligase PaaK-like adenylate-forming protein
LADVTVRNLPFLSKKIVMENFDRVVTDAHLRRRELEQWLDEVRDPKQRFRSDFIVMHSSGSSGTTGIFVYRRTDWQVMNSIMAARLPPPENHSGKTRVAFYRASHGHFAGVATAVHMSKSVYETLIVSVMDPLGACHRRVAPFPAPSADRLFEQHRSAGGIGAEGKAHQSPNDS